MKKIRLLSAAFALFLAGTAAFAQSTVKVTGVVTESGTGYEVPGVAISEKGSATNHAIADDSGNYSINVPKNAVLVFSAMGFQTVEVPVNGKTVVNVTLMEDAILLEGAVSVGYGSAKKVGNIVGNVATVKSDVVKNVPSQTALDALQGQVAGMQVLSSGGVAGDNSISMKIHGVGSLSSSSAPLFIVDGVQTTSTMVMQMNPNDIQTINVLKDASSTSIYGSLGANGVVYITTKSGAYDSRAKITATSQYGISTLSNYQFYDNLMSGDELKDFWIRSGLMTPSQIYTSYTSKGYNANTKWHEYMQNLVTPQYQNDVTIEGGSKTVAYLLSASQFHQDGTTIGNYYDRYTVRSNVQARPVKWLKAGVNVTGYLTSTRQNGSWMDSSFGNDLYVSGGLSYLMNPLYPAVDENGVEYAEKYPNGTLNQNYYVEKRQDSNKKVGINGAAFLEIYPIDGLTIASRLGTDSYVFKEDFKLLPSYAYSSNTQRYLDNSYSQRHTLTNTIEYAKAIKEHQFSVLLGQEWIGYHYSYNTLSAQGFTDDRLMDIQNGTTSTRSVSQGSSEYAFLSFFSHADYSYGDRYFIDGTFRYDASSRFGTNNRWAPFWAVGGMWKISKEQFLQDVSWIDDLSFRASYGTQGNASIGNYTHLGLVAVSSTKYNDQTYTYLDSPSNESLVWEKQKLLTLSLSSRLFDRVDLDLDFYNRVTSDMLLDVPQPYTTGFSEFTGNVGALQNTGIDITLGVDILKGKDYGLNLHATFNYNEDKITELFDGRQRWEIANTGIAYVVGKPIMFYYPIYAGVDPEDGAPMWYLPGEDKDVCTMDPARTTKVFNEDELTQNTGLRRNEPVSGGFGFNAHWKGLALTADFAYFGGKYLINNDAYFYANPNAFMGYNTTKSVSDFWTPYNKDAQYPDWSQGYQMEFDTHLLEDASFLRLKSLVLAYSLPAKWFQHSDVLKGVRVSVTGRNLVTFTKYTGLDPEVDSNLTVGLPGNTRQVLGGIELTF
jgi:TonB-dependent starch-binding outer membrane protein SusC